MKRWTQPIAALAALGFAAGGAFAQGDTDARVAEALSAAPPALAGDATVMDWEGNVLREGSSEWVCYPTHPNEAPRGKAPMCLDPQFQAWGEAWNGKTEPDFETVGISYMLAGDAGASNTDPYATEPTDDWVSAGPHLMIVVPDPADLSDYPTDPTTGGPWVMWQGTPYAHLMVPVEAGGPGQEGMHERHEKMKDEHEKMKEEHDRMKNEHDTMEEEAPGEAR